MLHAAFLRSPHRPRPDHRASTSTRPAGAQGVVAVFTGEDMEALTNPFEGGIRAARA